MVETKEEKNARLALEAEASKNDELPTDDAEARKDDAEAPETAEANVGAVVESMPSHLVEVELHEGNSDSILKNVHTVFHALGRTEFINGKANVNPDVAAYLKDSKQVK